MTARDATMEPNLAAFQCIIHHSKVWHDIDNDGYWMDRYVRCIVLNIVARESVRVPIADPFL